MAEPGAPGRALLEPRAADTELPSDDELVRGALAQDERCFELLLRRHEGAVVRVLRLLGVPARDREDVAQEVFLRVFRYLGRFRPGRPFSGWIYRITVNAAHDYRSRVGRRREEYGWQAGAGAAAVAPADPPAPGSDRDLRRLLETALTILTERERAVFVLREMEGLSTADVARSLGITRITVRRHLGRARHALQAFLSRSRSPG
jgi:RNA polymerase sigma-70 factor (ECF subfamily)